MDEENNFKELYNILRKIYLSFSTELKLLYLGVILLIISLIGYGMRYIIEKGIN